MCSFCDDDEKPANTSQLKEWAAEMLRLLDDGTRELRPVRASGRNLTRNFWGRQWMKHLALSETYGMRLAPGRTYLRCGCVLDLRIGKGSIEAIVAGESAYEVTIGIRPLDADEIEKLREACAGRLSSWIDLLKGETGPELLTILCDPESGILPNPEDWKMSCTCPDWADLCKHAAAALYAVGVLLDDTPELLFTLRGIRPENLLPTSSPESMIPDSETEKNRLKGKDLSSLFGIDLG